MEPTEQQIEAASAAMEAKRAAGHATAARYDAPSGRLVVSLHNGVEMAVPVHLVEELADADPADLAEIKISPAGLGLHWPALDADVYIPGLMAGALGSRAWMARELGAEGGRTSTPAKATAARANGAKGGRPRKQAG
ncbi:MAG: DUF2442 domain-containing protein [Jannaschia sp.]